MDNESIKRDAIAGWKVVQELSVRHGDFDMERIAKDTRCAPSVTTVAASPTQS